MVGIKYDHTVNVTGRKRPQRRAGTRLNGIMMKLEFNMAICGESRMDVLEEAHSMWNRRNLWRQ